MMFDIVLVGGTIVLPGYGLRQMDVGVKEGKIKALGNFGEDPQASEIIDVSGKFVAPGLVDPHVHFGLGEGINDFSTETASAAVGGVTSVLSFELNSNSYTKNFSELKNGAEKLAYVDFGFHFGMCTDEQLSEVGIYIDDYGVTSFKFFMNLRGNEISHLGLKGNDDGFLFELFQKLSSFPNAVLAVHPENVEIVNRLTKHYKEAGLEGLKVFADSKPPVVEAENVQRAVYYAQIVNGTIYIPHVSSIETLEVLKLFKQNHNKVYAETCPHYLTHTYHTELGVLAKSNPPLRGEEDREALWKGVKDGTIDCIGSDHVARPRSAKELKPFWEASTGCPGVAAILPIMLSEGYHKRGISLEQIVRLTSENPARIFGLYPAKGTLLPGADADITVIDLNKEKTFTYKEMKSISDYSLDEGKVLKGWPIMTLCRGKVVMNNGALVGESGWGRFLKRPL